jgi:hypothetical protein
MEPINPLSTASKAISSIQQQSKTYFESQLTQLGLGEEQIKQQTLEELQQSLENINDAIKNPDTFGVLNLRINPQSGAVIASNGSGAHVTLGILPILLERKKLILQRIRLLKGEEKIETIQDLVRNIPDEKVQEKLNREISELKSESQKIREQEQQVQKVQNEEQVRTQLEIAKLSMELFERRSKVWLSFLERESVATILGEILLILITLAQIGSMLLKIPPSDTLNNTFLVVLGYFFGQSTGRVAPNQGRNNATE